MEVILATALGSLITFGGVFLERRAREKDEFASALANYLYAVDGVAQAVRRQPQSGTFVTTGNRLLETRFPSVNHVADELMRVTIGRHLVRRADELRAAATRVLLVAPSDVADAVMATLLLIQEHSPGDEAWVARWKDKRAELQHLARIHVGPKKRGLRRLLSGGARTARRSVPQPAEAPEAG